jgi:DNA primase
LISEALKAHPEWFESLVTFPALCTMVNSPDPISALQDPHQRELIARIMIEAGRIPSYSAEELAGAAAIVTKRLLDGDDTRSLAETKPPGETEVQSAIQELQERSIETHLRDLRALIAGAERRGDHAELALLTQQKLDLDRSLRQLHNRKPPER